jgi:predicted transcriptional regulator
MLYRAMLAGLGVVLLVGAAPAMAFGAADVGAAFDAAMVALGPALGVEVQPPAPNLAPPAEPASADASLPALPGLPEAAGVPGPVAVDDLGSLRGDHVPEPPVSPPAPPDLGAPSALPVAGATPSPSAGGILFPAVPEPVGEGATILPPILDLPSSPGSAPGGAPASPGGSPASPSSPPGAVPGVGSTVAADMQPRQGLGAAFGEWASSAFEGAEGWYEQALPAEFRGALGGVAALVATGLLSIAAGFLGFRHVQRDNLFQNAFRHQLMNLVRDEPGLHLREIARRLSTTATNASYHLRVMERHGMLRSERLRGKRVFVPVAGREESKRHIARSVLLKDRRVDILRAVGAQPGANQSAIALQTNQHQGAVSWHLRQMLQVGLVAEERTPRECKYTLTPLGSDLLLHSPTLLASVPAVAVVEAVPTPPPAAVLVRAPAQLVAAPMGDSSA